MHDVHWYNDNLLLFRKQQLTAADKQHTVKKYCKINKISW